LDDQAKLAEGILDQAADAVIFADRSGKIARWNRASVLLFGFSAEEALGQSLDLIVPDHLRSAHWRGFDDAMANGLLKLQGRPTLTRALHMSGRKLYVEMTFALVAVDGAHRERLQWRATSRSGSRSRKPHNGTPPPRDDSALAQPRLPLLDRGQGA
jgi:PAS domain S-box-containing protein